MSTLNLPLARKRAGRFAHRRHPAATLMVVAAVGCGGLVAGRSDDAVGAAPHGVAGGGRDVSNGAGGAPTETSGGSRSTGGSTRFLGGGAAGVSGFSMGGNAMGGSATGGSATGGSATGGSVPVQVASRWTFEGATNLPTNFVDLRTDFPVTGFVLGDRMWLLATSSLSGDSRFSMWSSVDGLSWSFEGATNLPTNFIDLRTDFPVTGFILGDRMRLLATSSLSGDSRFSTWTSVDGLSWGFQGATDLPTNFVDLRTDFPVTGFVLGDRMWLLATSSLSGDSHYSMWECE